MYIVFQAFSTSLGRRGGQIGRGGIRNFGRGRRSSSVVRGGNRPLSIKIDEL